VLDYLKVHMKFSKVEVQWTETDRHETDPTELMSTAITNLNVTWFWS